MSKQASIVIAVSWLPVRKLFVWFVLQAQSRKFLLINFVNEVQFLTALITVIIVLPASHSARTCCHSSHFFNPLLATSFLILVYCTLQSINTVLADAS